MDLQLEDAQETELNMTPMIDIVFQLIIFFLLSLKFKTIDERIDSMLPKDRGQPTVPTIVEDEPKIALKVFRKEVGNRAAAYTLIKLDNSMQFRLPAGWKGRLHEPATRIEAYDSVVAAVTEAVRERVGIYGGLASGVKGEIKAPPPTGGSVPHGDVVALLDAFVDVGLMDVKFEGAATPLTKRERAARAGGG